MQEDEQAPAEAGADILTFPNSQERRLRVALRNLDAALAEQREAIAAFRAEMAALGTAVAGLGASSRTLQERLSDAAEDTA
ncbi:MAG: hypothetical protein B7Z53_02850, partial [Rhodospirillales bacterium 12-71-4]